MFTYPMIGNYGVNNEDPESGKIQVAGFIVREVPPRFSNWRAHESIEDYLDQEYDQVRGNVGLYRIEGCLATIEMPRVHPLIAPLVYAVPVQLLAYHVACVKGTDVDQPRNLAKTVTVE